MILIAFVAILDSQFPQSPRYEDKNQSRKVTNAVAVRRGITC